jgi:NADPH:quinone reductase-like Zn-dependent oxidoreductase
MQVVKDAGADVVVNHRTPGYLGNAKSAAGEGFDICLEMMASSNLAADLTIMRKHGRIGIIGSKAVPIEINPRLVMATELDVRGIFMPASTSAEVQDIHSELFNLLAEGAMSPIVGMVLPLAEAATAHNEVMAPSGGGATGNIVIEIDD